MFDEIAQNVVFSYCMEYALLSIHILLHDLDYPWSILYLFPSYLPHHTHTYTHTHTHTHTCTHTHSHPPPDLLFSSMSWFMVSPTLMAREGAGHFSRSMKTWSWCTPQAFSKHCPNLSTIEVDVSHTHTHTHNPACAIPTRKGSRSPLMVG